MDEVPAPSRPRWVKVSAIASLVAIALLVVVLVMGGPGGHDPGRHTGPDQGHKPPAWVPDHGRP